MGIYANEVATTGTPENIKATNRQRVYKALTSMKYRNRYKQKCLDDASNELERKYIKKELTRFENDLRVNPMHKKPTMTEAQFQAHIKTKAKKKPKRPATIKPPSEGYCDVENVAARENQ